MMRIVLLGLLFSTFALYGQDGAVYIDIRGEIQTYSGRGVPFANILLQKEGNGTAADYYGKFRIFARPGDTLRISAIGFKKAIIPIPGDLNEGIYPLRVSLSRDTVYLSETVITPWPETWGEFRMAFLELDVPGDAPVIEIPASAIRQAIRDAKPEGGISFPGPVSLLYNAFSKEAKYRRKYEALSQESTRFETIYRRLGHSTLATLCGTEERHKMEALITGCKLEDLFIAQASDIELIRALAACISEKEDNNPNIPDQ